MNQNNTFKHDLAGGEKIELEVLDHIRLTCPDAYKIEGKFSGFDLMVPGYGGVEVKHDKMCAETGNVVIEVDMFNQPSALSITKARLWVIVTPEKILYIRPEMIRKCIYTTNIRSVKFTGHGDTASKIAYLVKLDRLEKYADRVIDNGGG